MIQYILQSCFAGELPARQQYLYHTFHRFFLETHRTGELIELRSFPLIAPEIVFLYGHCPWVLAYIDCFRSDLKDKTIVIHSCYPELIVPCLKQREVYFCKVNRQREAICYHGADYGLSFDVTISELDALRAAHLPLNEQIQFAYWKVA